MNILVITGSNDLWEDILYLLYNVMVEKCFEQNIESY